jgi:D-alanine transaminase
MTTCFLNGNYLDVKDAKISVLDRGFIFGDSVYEVLTSQDGAIFGLNDHLNRLEKNLSEVMIPIPMSRDGWREVLAKLISIHEKVNLSLYIQVSRGVAPRMHAFPQGVKPTVFVMCQPYVGDHEFRRVTCVTLEDNRWGRCDIKTTSLLPNLLLKNAAIEKGTYEAILVRDGYVTEGASSNIFIVKDSHVFTPSTNDRTILPGVTRKLICDVVKSVGIQCTEREVRRDELLCADEIWLTSSTSDIVAVNILDQMLVGNDSAYPLGRRIHKAFKDYKADNLLGL